MNLLLKKTNLIFIIFTFLFTSSLPVSADRLSSMVDGVLESHEDIVNSKKELEEAEHSIGRALNEKSEEIISEHLRQANRSLERIIGKIDIEDVLGNIFSKFCIGK